MKDLKNLTDMQLHMLLSTIDKRRSRRIKFVFAWLLLCMATLVGILFII